MNELEFETTNRIRRRLGLTALIAATNSLKAVRLLQSEVPVLKAANDKARKMGWIV